MTAEDRFATHPKIITDLKDFATFREMRSSDAYRRHRNRLSKLFNTPQLYRAPEAEPRLTDFLRVVVWNIERGTQLQGIADVLNHHPILRWADLLLLNELDIGMTRSGNVNVPLELSRALSAHAIFGVEYLEFTKGTGDELNLPGENTAALHGNAILTRHNFSDPRIRRLPRCENNFESAEKRLGGRHAILVNIETGGANLLAATAHFDVVSTPRCRAAQLRAVLSFIAGQFSHIVLSVPERRTGRMEEGNYAFIAKISKSRYNFPQGAVILGGDFNTHTFARGGQLRALKNVIRIFGVNRERLTHSLMQREPAIRELERFGFDIDNFNDDQPTSSSVVSALDDKGNLPAPVRWWALRKSGPEGLRLEFRLDWLAARGVRALRVNEITDAATGVQSISPQTIKDLEDAGKRLSDHDPIVVDIALI